MCACVDVCVGLWGCIPIHVGNAKRKEDIISTGFKTGLFLRMCTIDVDLKDHTVPYDSTACSRQLGTTVCHLLYF